MGVREQNPRDKGIGSRRRCGGVLGKPEEAGRKLVRGKFCLGSNLTEALESSPLVLQQMAVFV